MAGPAQDQLNLNAKLDTLDSQGPVARDFQQAYHNLQECSSLLFKVTQGDPSGNGLAATYVIGENFTEAQRAAYKILVDTAITAVAAANAAFVAIIKFP